VTLPQDFSDEEMARDRTLSEADQKEVIGTNGTQSQVLHTSCSKPLNLDDQFGALILREFYPKTH
jgi:hypothetical protein